MLSERFSHSSSFQYFHPLPRLLHFQTFLARSICGEFKGACVNEAAALSYASYVDVDFDAISHAVTVAAFWRQGIEAEAARTLPRRWREGDSVEVGVLQAEEAEEAEELKMGGYLTVIGEEDGPSMPSPHAREHNYLSLTLQPGPTLFSFPSRHHPLPQSTSNSNSTPGLLTFSAHFQHPTGLHPKLSLTVPSRQHLSPPKEGSCALHAYLTLPSALFIDRYQLADPLFLASQNLVKLHSLSGEQDLEAPGWVIQRWGSAALLELAQPPPLTTNADTNTREAAGAAAEEHWTVTIPTHLRYVQSSSNSSTQTESIDIPHPHLFWACEAEDGLKMSVNPFDRVNLGYDGLFGPKTMFYHIPPSPSLSEASLRSGLVETLQVPVLGPEVGGGWGVQMGTLGAVMLGFGWAVWMLVRSTAGRKGVGGEKRGEGVKAE